jgi:acetyl-CoA synthetase
VRSVIGTIATPDKLQFAPGLPKTRSGRIMRRILRKIAHNQMDELGDTSVANADSIFLFDITRPHGYDMSHSR